MEKESKKYCFKPQDDVDLLKLVVVDPPFRAKHGQTQQKWVELLSKLDLDISWRTLRDRFNLLVKQFKTTNADNLKKSGTEEEYTEKEVLLQEICDLMRESETSQDSSQTGKEIRENSLKHLNQTETNFISTPKRKKETDILQILPDATGTTS